MLKRLSSNKLDVVLLGHGLDPAGYDPRIDVVAVDAHMELVQLRLRTVASLASSMPTIDEILDASQPADRVGAS
jgi:hypothetical protein